MKLLRRRDTQAVVDGHVAAHAAGLGSVQSFLGDMRLEAATMPAPAPRPSLAATLDGRRPLRPASDAVLQPLPSARRAPVHLRLRPVAAAIASGAVLFGGLASANALPAPVQHASAELTSHLGIHLPGLAQHSPVAPPSGNNGPTTRHHGVAPHAPATAAPPGQTPATTGPTTTTKPGLSTVPTTIPGTPTRPTTPALPIPIPIPITVPITEPGTGRLPVKVPIRLLPPLPTTPTTLVPKKVLPKKLFP